MHLHHSLEPPKVTGVYARNKRGKGKQKKPFVCEQNILICCFCRDFAIDEKKPKRRLPGFFESRNCPQGMQETINF